MRELGGPAAALGTLGPELRMGIGAALPCIASGNAADGASIGPPGNDALPPSACSAAVADTPPGYMPYPDGARLAAPGVVNAIAPAIREGPVDAELLWNDELPLTGAGEGPANGIRGRVLVPLLLE